MQPYKKETKQTLTEKEQRKLIESKVKNYLQSLNEVSVEDMIMDKIVSFFNNSKFSQEIVTRIANELVKKISIKISLDK